MIHKGKISAGNSDTKHGNFNPGTRQKPEAWFVQMEARHASGTMPFWAQCKQLAAALSKALYYPK